MIRNKKVENPVINDPEPIKKNLEGAALVREVITLVLTTPGRLPDAEGKPGGLIRFPKNLRPIIIGDLHAEPGKHVEDFGPR